MKKKVVWLPYDFDTAIGINNEGSLVFGYELEDIDHTESGADIYNGQNSVMWTNLRDAFGAELAAMYKNLRSQGKLSYEAVEKAFEDHQGKWPEAIFNEDAWFKYIQPLIDDGTGSYLEMLQGSKAEQRKWWLYNRFRYIDSKYNAGDALSDVVQLRGYAKADITIRPYADIYPSVKYGSYLVQKRGKRGTTTTLECPLDNVNDTEIYIYSASQLASVGDLSGLLVGFADFSMAMKLQELKIGDSASTYNNGNLTTLTLGNNVLLKKIDVRNCTALTQAVDLSGCETIEEVYFEGTAVTGVTLPNGGVLRVLHLPETITNLTIQNQKAITELVAPLANISTLRIENCPTVDTKSIINTVPESTRVRLIGFAWEAEDADEIYALLDTLDKMRGLDESGNNTETAQVSGVIHTSSLTGAQIADFNSRYPYLTVRADHTRSELKYYTYDGSELLYTETVLDGGDGGAYTGSPSRSSTAQYNYSFAGWSRRMDSLSVDSNALTAVTADRNVYAAYTATTRTYTATFVRASGDGGGTLYTQTNVPYGRTPTYGGETPTTTQGSAEDYPFEGWTPALSAITGNTTYTAVFGSPIEVAEITDSWEDIVTAAHDGTYNAKYKVGNYKYFTLEGGETVRADIVGKNVDAKTNGQSSPLSFLIRYPFSCGTWASEYPVVSWTPSDTADTDAFKFDQTWHGHFDEASNTYVTSGRVWIQASRYHVEGEIETATLTITCEEAIAIRIGYRSFAGRYTEPKATLNGADFSLAQGDFFAYYSATLTAGTNTLSLSLVAKDAYQNNEPVVYFDLPDNKEVTCTLQTNKVHSLKEVNITGDDYLGGYPSSTIKKYIDDNIILKIPETIRNAIVPVTKESVVVQNTQSAEFGESSVTSSERVWLFSIAELSSSSSDAPYRKYMSIIGPDNLFVESAAQYEHFLTRDLYAKYDLKYSGNNAQVRAGYNQRGFSEVSIVSSTYKSLLGFCL